MCCGPHCPHSLLDGAVLVERESGTSCPEMGWIQMQRIDSSCNSCFPWRYISLSLFSPQPPNPPIQKLFFLLLYLHCKCVSVCCFGRAGNNLHDNWYSHGCFICFSIGYPVVTLGFGFKSYISYRLRLVRAKKVLDFDCADLGDLCRLNLMEVL